MMDQDRAYMAMAYALAERALGRASPNPYVGAVLVRNGVIVGSGFHEGPGRPHAEIVALRQAGRRAGGATAYITLEPCVHWGRTPPCIDSLLPAKLKRVVISGLDPNPLVYTKGVRRLRQAGLSVEVGLLEEKNRRLNEAYIKHITRRMPFVTVKAAASLDGRMATRKRDARWITSEGTRDYAHLLRGECDALMVGVGTVLQDDPILTVRHSLWNGKRIMRVLVDSRLRLPRGARILSTKNKGRIVVATLSSASPRKAAWLEKQGVEVVPFPPRGGRVDLEAVLRWLGKHEVASLLVEGGSDLISTILERRLADKVVLMQAPRLIGGSEAPAFIAGRGVDLIRQALSLKNVRSFGVGPDLIIEGYL